jgi:hypothetical protein
MKEKMPKSLKTEAMKKYETAANRVGRETALP